MVMAEQGKGDQDTKKKIESEGRSQKGEEPCIQFHLIRTVGRPSSPLIEERAHRFYRLRGNKCLLGSGKSNPPVRVLDNQLEQKDIVPGDAIFYLFEASDLVESFLSIREILTGGSQRSVSANGASGSRHESSGCVGGSRSA